MPSNFNRVRSGALVRSLAVLTSDGEREKKAVSLPEISADRSSNMTIIPSISAERGSKSWNVTIWNGINKII